MKHSLVGCLIEALMTRNCKLISFFPKNYIFRKKIAINDKISKWGIIGGKLYRDSDVNFVLALNSIRDRNQFSHEKSLWALATSSDNLHIDIFATQHRTYVIGKDFGNRLWRHLNVICPILCTCSNLSIDGAPSHKNTLLLLLF